jgi:hypothetical protein
MTRWIGTVLALGAAVFLLTACGRLNRTATLNQSTPGLVAAIVLQHQLARQGHPAARVTCAKTLVVNVGITYVCGVRGAGAFRSVRFTFTSPRGTINLSSVKPS